MSLDLHDQALEELQMLRQLAPAEPSVHLQIGKAFKRLGDLERVSRRDGRSPTDPRLPFGPQNSLCFACGNTYHDRDERPSDEAICSVQAQQAMEVALSFSTNTADAGSIKTAIEKLALNEEQEEEEL